MEGVECGSRAGLHFLDDMSNVAFGSKRRFDFGQVLPVLALAPDISLRRANCCEKPKSGSRLVKKRPPEDGLGFDSDELMIRLPKGSCRAALVTSHIAVFYTGRLFA